MVVAADWITGPTWQWTFTAVSIVVTVAWALAGMRFRRARSAELRALARSLGCDFDPNSLPAKAPRYEPFACFARGSYRRAENTIHGVWKSSGRPHPVWMGDFKFTDPANDDDRRFSYLLVQLPLVDVPDLVIRRAGVMDAIGSALGVRTIQFESAEFNRQFHVWSNNPRFASDVVSPTMMAFLLDGDPPDVEVRGGYCCVNAEGRKWSAAEFRERLRWLERFLNLWPGFLAGRLEERRE